MRSKSSLPCTSQQLLYNAQASRSGIPNPGNTGLTKSQHQEREGLSKGRVQKGAGMQSVILMPKHSSKSFLEDSWAGIKRHKSKIYATPALQRQRQEDQKSRSSLATNQYLGHTVFCIRKQPQADPDPVMTNANTLLEPIRDLWQ